MKWKERLEAWRALTFSEVVNVVVLIVSIVALVISGISLRVSIKSLDSAEKSGSVQQQVLEASRNSLNAVVDKLNVHTRIQYKQYSTAVKSASEQQRVLNISRKSLEAVVSKLNIQTQLQLKQYEETLLRPKVRAFYWNLMGDKVELFPSEFVYDEKTQTYHGRGPTTSSPRPIELKKQADGRAFFDVIIENVGDRDLAESDISLGCNVPIETYSLGETGRSTPAPADPHSGDWTINFTKKLLPPFKLSQDVAVYKFSTNGPFPKVYPDGMFGCFLRVKAPGLTPFVSGGFLRVVK